MKTKDSNVTNGVKAELSTAIRGAKERTPAYALELCDTLIQKGSYGEALDCMIKHDLGKEKGKELAGTIYDVEIEDIKIRIPIEKIERYLSEGQIKEVAKHNYMALVYKEICKPNAFSEKALSNFGDYINAARLLDKEVRQAQIELYVRISLRDKELASKVANSFGFTGEEIEEADLTVMERRIAASGPYAEIPENYLQVKRIRDLLLDEYRLLVENGNRGFADAYQFGEKCAFTEAELDAKRRGAFENDMKSGDHEKLGRALQIAKEYLEGEDILRAANAVFLASDQNGLINPVKFVEENNLGKRARERAVRESYESGLHKSKLIPNSIPSPNRTVEMLDEKAVTDGIKPDEVMAIKIKVLHSPIKEQDFLRAAVIAESLRKTEAVTDEDIEALWTLHGLNGRIRLLRSEDNVTG